MGAVAVIVACCEHKNRRTNGITAAGATRYRCKDCGKSWTESTSMFGGMRIGMDRAEKIVSMICEGVSVLATSRLTDTDPHTIIDLVNYLGHFHVSTDGFKSYPSAIRKYLGHRVDHGVMTKVYGRPITYPYHTYSPAGIIGAYRTPMHGDAYQQDKICTSHVERHNLSIRTFIKRMNRLTCCFSKRWENHRAALGMFFMHYNYCRKHSSLSGQTPAMAHGLATDVWSVKKMLQTVLSDTEACTHIDPRPKSTWWVNKCASRFQQRGCQNKMV